MINFSLIIPTYNESQNILILIDRIINLLEKNKISFEVIVVDDDSKDLTWKIVGEKFNSDSRIRVVRRVNEKGLSSAVLKGMSIAKGKYFGVIDADLQHDEQILPEMLKQIESHDVVVGSRVVGDGGYGEWGFTRKLMSKIATLLAKIMLPINIGDPMSGFFILKKEIFEEVLPKVNPIGFKILLEFIARKKGIKTTEVGYVFKNRIYGETKMSSSVIQNYLVALYDIRFGEVISLKFLKYAFIGFLGVFVNLFGQFLAKSFLNLTEPEIYRQNFTKPFYAVCFGFEISVLSNYIFNNIWTFKESRKFGFRENVLGFIKFNLISILGFLIQVSVWRFSFELIQKFSPELMFNGIDYICNFFGIMLATAGNYFLNKNFTWSEK